MTFVRNVMQLLAIIGMKTPYAYLLVTPALDIMWQLLMEEINVYVRNGIEKNYIYIYITKKLILIRQFIQFLYINFQLNLFLNSLQ